MRLRNTILAVLGTLAVEGLKFSGVFPGLKSQYVHMICTCVLAALSGKNLYVNPDGTPAQCPYEPWKTDDKTSN